MSQQEDTVGGVSSFKDIMEQFYLNIPQSIREVIYKWSLVLFAGGILFSVASCASAEVSISPDANGLQISADTNGTNGSGLYTALTGPILAEGALGDIGKGTLILNAPSGFEFDTGTNSTASVTNGSCVGSGNKVLKLGTGSGSSSQTVTPTSSTITIQVKQESASNTGRDECRGTLTFTGIRVRPTLAGSTLSSGDMTKTGTSIIEGVTDSTTSLGAFIEIAGAISASRSILETNPAIITADGVSSSAITATIRDQFDTPISGATVLLTASGTGNTVNQPTSASNTSGQTQGSIISTQVGTKTITAEANSTLITQTVSVTFSPGEVVHINILTQPVGGGSVDTALTTQPVLRVTDKEGNLVADGTVVTASLVSGTGTLRNTSVTTLAGDASFTNLGYSKSGESFTVSFTAGLASSTSESITALSAGVLTTTFLTPSDASITVGDLETYGITGTDQFGNSLGDLTGQTTFTSSSDSIGSFGTGDALPKVQSREVGVVTITATTSGKTVQTSLTVLPLSPPSALPIAGAYTTYQDIVLHTDTDYEIRYTVDGSDPLCATRVLFTTPIQLVRSTVLKALVCRTNTISSGVSTFDYDIKLPSANSAVILVPISIPPYSSTPAPLPQSSTGQSLETQSLPTPLIESPQLQIIDTNDEKPIDKPRRRAGQPQPRVKGLYTDVFTLKKDFLKTNQAIQTFITMGNIFLKKLFLGY